MPENSLINFKNALPDPPTLAFLEKARVFPQKSKGFSLRGTPKKKKQGKSENEKSKEIEKSKDWRVRAERRKLTN